MITNALQKKAYDAVAAALPFAIDPAKITVAPGLSYTKSPIKAHDCAAGVMAAFGSVVEHLGTVRGLPAQTMKLDRRLCGLLLNGIQIHFLNGYCTIMDTWPVGPDNGIYRAKDGRYVAMIGLHPHLRDALLDHFQAANTAKAIQASVEKKTAQQIEDEVAVLNLPLGIVRSSAEWLTHPQGEATAKRPMIDIEQIGGARKRALGPARHRPLEGVRVIELSYLVAGPTTARLLAEQGAEVIRIQSPMGDWQTPLMLETSWGKKNVTLDIKSRAGKNRLVDLIGGADVIVSSLRPGAFAHIGLDDSALSEINPNLVFAQISYCASGTPWAARKGLEQIAQAVTGVVDINSTGEPEPNYISVLINDYITGYLGAIGVMAALTEREQRGGYWHVGASLTRCATLAVNLVEPRDAEEYAPVTMQDLVDYGIDQVTPWGIFTRLAPAVDFSHTPSMAVWPTNWPGTYPDTTGWTESPAGDAPPKLPHYASKLAREGGIRNLVSCYGIVDRGDGRGGFSLASKELLEYAEAMRRGDRAPLARGRAGSERPE
jgi:crotonobetainyl-CoA:carnitine CoA-transferase CaiB-like acyl-CoA transferase